MNMPKLKMNKADVQTAISRKFKQEVSTLTFNKNQSFSAVDSSGVCSFTLQRAFDGIGEYRIEGRVKLWNDEAYSSCIYNLGGQVNVSEKDTEPEITFEEPISAQKL